MAYPDKLARFNINASIVGGEVMVHTVWLRRDTDGFGNNADLQTMADKVRDDWAKSIGGFTGGPPGLGGYLHNATTYTSVDAYAVDAAGHATQQAESLFAAGVTGEQTNALPPQNAVVVTLKTSRPGRSGRGRLYLGGFGTNILAPTGRLSTVARDAFAANLAGFYTRLRDLPLQGDGFRPVVVSPRLTQSFKIAGIEVGDVVDTMRSRRSDLLESRKSAVVDAS